MRLSHLWLFMYVECINENKSRKLAKNVYSSSQVQEASHLELTNLSFNYLSSPQIEVETTLLKFKL